MTDDNKLDPPSWPRATTMDEYNAKQEAERAKTVRLRELRQAAEAKGTSEPKAKAKREPGGKAKRA